MKRLFIFLLCLCALLSVQAQNIPNGSKWWSGTDLYTATIRAGGVVYFQGSDDNELTIEKDGDKAGAYKIIPSRQAEDRPPLRGEFGWRVQHIRQEDQGVLKHMKQLRQRTVMRQHFHHIGRDKGQQIHLHNPYLKKRFFEK